MKFKSYGSRKFLAEDQRIRGRRQSIALEFQNEHGTSCGATHFHVKSYLHYDP